MARTSFSSVQKEQLLEALKHNFGTVVSRANIMQHIARYGLPTPWFILDKMGIGGGMFNLGSVASNVSAPVSQPVQQVSEQVSEDAPAMLAAVVPLKQKKLQTEVDNLVPHRDPSYVPFGFFKDLESVIKSRRFYPIFVSGLSGNGKTFMVEQVCARLSRECLRVNISIETDEDDLIGGNTLVDGNVVYREGPMLTAMKRGAVVILDEIDRGSNKLMCLQAILEGKPYFNKKTGEVVHPAPGFTVVATANTKGRGTDDGKFIAAQILDEAFLERFPVTVEQEYPAVAVEKKIVMNNMESRGCVDADFCEKLVNWADIIRKTFLEGGIDELISTRRLVHIVEAFSIFGDRKKAIQLCINRFDDETKHAFFDLYTKVDVEKVEVAAVSENVAVQVDA
jgi:MoxR-like ATPase